MSYKTILVHMDRGERAAVRLEVGLRLAHQFDAHLVGLHALKVAPVPGYVLAAAGTSLAGEHRQAALEEAAATERIFTEMAARAGSVRTEWRSSLVDAARIVPLHARYADLVILGQPGGAAPPGVDREFAQHVLLSCGRPVLFIPFAGEWPTLGRRALVSWDAGREATNAVTAALPLLKRAARVDVVVFNPEGLGHGAVPGADVGLWLSRHGVPVQVSEEHAPDKDIGNHLLSLAADLGSDLVVMGGYGHSRFSELVLGGVTRTVMDSMTVPVLMAH